MATDRTHGMVSAACPRRPPRTTAYRPWFDTSVNVGRLLTNTARRVPERTAVTWGDQSITYAEFDRRATALARGLAGLGVGRGDRVGVFMRNRPELLESMFACFKAGYCLVPLNSRFTSDEVGYHMVDSGAAAIIAEEVGEAVVAGADLGGAATVVTGDGYEDLLARSGGDGAGVEIDVDGDDLAWLFYTSGTTGRPKGAVGTHRNICTNLMNLFFINTRGQMRFGSSLADTTGKTQPAYLLSVPLFHATGCHAVMVTNLAAGGKIVMMHHFDPERALELIERERIATFGGVPAMVMQVLDSPNFSKHDTSSIRGVSYGGAPAPPDLVRRIRAAWPIGQPSNGYGLTETSSVTSMNSGGDYIARPESVGPPVPVTDVAIVPEDFTGDEPDDTIPRGPDVRGELWIKGPQVVRGYWHRPDETAQTFTKGWLHSGDVARLDEDNFIYIVDRAKDMIIRGGENVYSVQVEAALFEHPAVADCAVIGVPEPTLGEEVGAVIVLRPGFKVAADELSKHVKERLAGFMVPTHIWFREEPLPRNAAGKVLKRELRDELVGTPTAQSKTDLESPA
ncbi:MAG TPA: AMP-binding protein [Acidimicrobiales bacterium]|nr:AMP-binding protein [Acidimicrobiales bacterium]